MQVHLIIGTTLVFGACLRMFLIEDLGSLNLVSNQLFSHQEEANSGNFYIRRITNKMKLNLIKSDKDLSLVHSFNFLC